MKRFDPRIQFPRLLTYRFKEALWRVPVQTDEVFLTFDDGPVPEVTNMVLDLLKKEDVKACFFCVGENVKRHPNIYQRILDEGHQVGNHTFNHLQGVKTTDTDFLQNIAKASEYIESNLFRPPHGQMSRSQYKQIKQQYQVVMWDVISGDYKKTLSPGKVVHNVMDFVRPGSIIIFHDSLKAWQNLYHALPIVVKELKMRGYQFGSLPVKK